MKKNTQAKKSPHQKKSAPKGEKRVLTEEQRLKRNAYMREYLREYNKDPEHRKARAEYQKARYHRIKAESEKKARASAKAAAKASPSKPRKPLTPKTAAVKKTVKIGKGGGSKGK